MRVDKTLSELWNLADDGDVGEVAKMAIKAIQGLQEENQLLSAFKFHAVSVMSEKQIDKVVSKFKGK